MDDISTAYPLLIDIERTKSFLKEYEKVFILSELEDDNLLYYKNNKKEEDKKAEVKK